MEKVYKTMQRTGACSIAVGVIILVTGVTVGIMSIVCGGLLLKRRVRLHFRLKKRKSACTAGTLGKRITKRYRGRQFLQQFRAETASLLATELLRAGFDLN